MTDSSKKQPEDANLAGFRALLAKKKAARAASTGPARSDNKTEQQKPRAKERMRRRP